MPNDTEQPTDRAGRRTLVILFVAAAVVVGLWYALERPRLPEPAVDTSAPAGDSRTGGTGTTSTVGVAQTAEPGTASPGGEARTAGSGAASPGGEARTAGSDAASPGSGTQAADPDTGSPGDDAQAADSGATSPDSTAQTVDSGTALPDSAAQSAGSGAAFPDSEAQSAGSDAASPDSEAQSAGSDAASPDSEAQAARSGNALTGDDLRTAGTGAAASREPGRLAASETTDDDPARIAAGSGAAPVDGAPVDETPRVAPAPDSTIAQVPVDAPPSPVDAPSGTETAGKTSLLAAIESVIERVENTVGERLSTGSEAAPDSTLELQITYDDSKRDAARTGAAPNEPARASGPGATRPSDHAPASGARPPESAGSPEPGIAAPSSDLAAGTAAAPSPDLAAGTAAAPSPDLATGLAGIPAGTETAPETEAEEYVESLTGTAPWTIPVDEADHFVTPEHVISLVPEDSIENVSVAELAGDETLSPDTPITVVREVEQIEETGAERIIAESGGDLDRELRVQVTYDDSQDKAAPKVVEADTVERITVREALERIRTEPDKPLPVIRKVRYFEVLTLKELLAGAADGEPFLKVVTRPYRIESATLADLLRRQQAENPDSIFYIHTVQPTDEQGIWGIVHSGLIDNFARGVAIRRGEAVETYTVRIPRDADERLPDRSSSFLGLMIDRKTRDSYVYNFRDHRMGRNPDRIFPGQELVIIKFEPEDLMAIYRHFAASRSDGPNPPPADS